MVQGLEQIREAGAMRLLLAYASCMTTASTAGERR
jgi:hypothetical protein